MGLKKIRVLPDQYIVNQGEKGETAFLVISGGLVAEVNGKKVGKTLIIKEKIKKKSENKFKQTCGSGGGRREIGGSRREIGGSWNT